MSADDKLEPVAWLIGDPGTGRWVETSEARAEYSASIGRPVLPIITASALEASEAKIAALTAENATLREALAPFAEAADSYEPPESDDHQAAWAHDFTIGSLRRARAALRQEGKP